nr:hypothetical protein [Tanacetum cinerariifolium]
MKYRGIATVEVGGGGIRGQERLFGSCRKWQEVVGKGKKIAKPITPPYESASKEDNDPEQSQRDKDMQKNLALIAKFFKKIYKPTNTTSELLQTLETRTWILIQADTEEEIDEQELEAHYNYMEKIKEVPTADSGTDTEPLEQVQYNDEYNVFANERQHFEQPGSSSNTCVVKKVDSNVILNSPDMCDNDIQTDLNAKDERAALANLIANLKLDVDENKKDSKAIKESKHITYA